MLNGPALNRLIPEQSSTLRVAASPGSLTKTSRGASGFELPNGINLAREEFGTKDGFPALFFPNSGSSRIEAAFFHTCAKRHGFRLIAIDRPGIGQSDYFRYSSTVEYCQQLLLLADFLKLDRFCTMSLGAGGIFAVTLAHLAPRRVAQQICIGGVPGNVFNESTEHSAVNTLINRFTPACIDYSLRLSHGVFSHSPEKMLGRLREYLGPCDHKAMDDPRVLQLLQLDQQEAQRYGYKGIAQDLATCYRKLEFSLQELEVPIIVWRGAADRLTMRSDCEYLVSHAPRASLHRIPNAGHFFFLQHMDDIFSRLRSSLVKPATAA